MAVHERTGRGTEPRHPQSPAPTASHHEASVSGTERGFGASQAGRLLAVLRVAAGLIFLWAFLDKMFALGWATPSGRGWVEGGSPTAGFLGSVSVGPFESLFNSWAGAAWADWLFMLGLLGVGLALVLGVALWPAAIAGALMLAFLWVAVWPPARFLSDGSPSGSTNPLVDQHVVYAAAAFVLASTRAGDTWGLGRLWSRVAPVERFPWIR
ncbi:DoxX family membrane protein [Streptomyces sp. ST2-7A]|uniref:DoxX family membrane protein n=1 Tax=Streptomyces sp. ST2-7A TaxID=2907214 RepID=UPI001F465309|nr:DoxX family membrane protein [Streptomyces sp. ST2-7A]MCE7083069.1 DoxX family membrane protein [Streptomyces sp. ST2-7A]